MLLVVQSTMVTPSSVRGSAPRPTTISFVRARSCASAAGAARLNSVRPTASTLRARMDLSLHAELGIEGIAQPVAEQIHAERGEGQRESRKGGQPPGDVEKIAALTEHASPRRRGRLHAEAEEADGGLGHDELRE